MVVTFTFMLLKVEVCFDQTLEYLHLLYDIISDLLALSISHLIVGKIYQTRLIG